MKDRFLTLALDLGTALPAPPPLLPPTSWMIALAAALLKTGEAMVAMAPADSELEGPLPTLPRLEPPTDPVFRRAPPANGGLDSLLGELLGKT